MVTNYKKNATTIATTFQTSTWKTGKSVWTIAWTGLARYLTCTLSTRPLLLKPSSLAPYHHHLHLNRQGATGYCFNGNCPTTGKQCQVSQQPGLILIEKNSLSRFMSFHMAWSFIYTRTCGAMGLSLEKMSASSITTSKAPLRFVINCLKILLLQVHTKFKYWIQGNCGENKYKYGGDSEFRKCSRGDFFFCIKRSLNNHMFFSHCLTFKQRHIVPFIFFSFLSLLISILQE